MLLRGFNIFVMLYYFFSIWYDLNYVDFQRLIPSSTFNWPFKGRLKYLTIWNMLLQATFFTICVLNNFVGTNEVVPKNKSLIRKLRDTMLAALAFPLSMFVGLTFWGIYAIDRELVFPKALDPFFPTWLNHVMHTNIMIFILLQMYLSYHDYPPRKTCITILATFMCCYLIWIHILYSYSGVWVYPILEVLNFPMRLVFFISLLGLGLGLYMLGEKLNSIVWRNEIQKVGRRKRN